MLMFVIVDPEVPSNNALPSRADCRIETLAWQLCELSVDQFG